MSTTNTVHQQYRPHLWNDLRLALSVLYCLPTQQQQEIKIPQNISSKEAHEYLMNFQSRNVRRKIKSQTQRNNDQNKTDVDLLQ